MVVFGDFNVHPMDCLGSDTTYAAGQHTLKMSNSLGLQQIVAEPTRQDQIVDLVLTALSAIATVHAIAGTSDHNPVLVQLDMPTYSDKPYRLAQQ